MGIEKDFGYRPANFVDYSKVEKKQSDKEEAKSDKTSKTGEIANAALTKLMYEEEITTLSAKGDELRVQHKVSSGANILKNILSFIKAVINHFSSTKNNAISAHAKNLISGCERHLKLYNDDIAAGKNDFAKVELKMLLDLLGEVQKDPSITDHLPEELKNTKNEVFSELYNLALSVDPKLLSSAQEKPNTAALPKRPLGYTPEPFIDFSKKDSDNAPPKV